MARPNSSPVRHPGAILLDQVMWPFEISQNELAREMGVSPRCINEIVLGKRAITARTAVLLELALGLPARHWMRLQADYDIERVRPRCHGPAVRPRMPPRPYDEDVPFDDPAPERDPECRLYADPEHPPCADPECRLCADPIWGG